MNSFETSDQMDFNSLSNTTNRINEGVQRIERDERMANSSLNSNFENERNILTSLKDAVLATGNKIGNVVADGARQTGQFIKDAYQSNKQDFEIWNPERTALRVAAATTGPLGVAVTRMLQNMNFSLTGMTKSVAGTIGNGVKGLGGMISKMRGNGNDTDMDVHNIHSGPQLPEQLLNQNRNAQQQQAQEFQQLNRQTIANTERLVNSIDQIKNEICGISDPRTGKQSHRQQQEQQRIPQNVEPQPRNVSSRQSNEGGGSSGNQNPNSLGGILSEIRDLQAKNFEAQQEYLDEHAQNNDQGKFLNTLEKLGNLEQTVGNFIGHQSVLLKWTSFFHGKYSRDIPRSKNPLNTLVNAALKIYEWNRIYGDVSHRQLNELIKLQGGKPQNLVGEKSPFSMFVKKHMTSLKNTIKSVLFDKQHSFNFFGKEIKSQGLMGLGNLNNATGGLLKRATSGALNIFGDSAARMMGAGQSEEEVKDTNTISQQLKIINRSRRKRGEDAISLTDLSDTQQKELATALNEGVDFDSDSDKEEYVLDFINKIRSKNQVKSKKGKLKLAKNAKFKSIMEGADALRNIGDEKAFNKYMSDNIDDIRELAEDYGIDPDEVFGEYGEGALGSKSIDSNNKLAKIFSFMQSSGIGSSILNPFGLQMDMNQAFGKNDFSKLFNSKGKSSQEILLGSEIQQEQLQDPKVQKLYEKKQAEFRSQYGDEQFKEIFGDKLPIEYFLQLFGDEIDKLSKPKEAISSIANDVVQQDMENLKSTYSPQIVSLVSALEESKRGIPVRIVGRGFIEETDPEKRSESDKRQQLREEVLPEDMSGTPPRNILQTLAGYVDNIFAHIPGMSEDAAMAGPPIPEVAEQMGEQGTNKVGFFDKAKQFADDIYHLAKNKLSEGKSDSTVEVSDESTNNEPKTGGILSNLTSTIKDLKDGIVSGFTGSDTDPNSGTTDTTSGIAGALTVAMDKALSKDNIADAASAAASEQERAYAEAKELAEGENNRGQKTVQGVQVELLQKIADATQSSSELSQEDAKNKKKDAKNKEGGFLSKLFNFNFGEFGIGALGFGSTLLSIGTAIASVAATAAAIYAAIKLIPKGLNKVSDWFGFDGNAEEEPEEMANGGFIKHLPLSIKHHGNKPVTNYDAAGNKVTRYEDGEEVTFGLPGGKEAIVPFNSKHPRMRKELGQEQDYIRKHGRPSGSISLDTGSLASVHSDDIAAKGSMRYLALAGLQNGVEFANGGFSETSSNVVEIATSSAKKDLQTKKKYGWFDTKAEILKYLATQNIYGNKKNLLLKKAELEYYKVIRSDSTKKEVKHTNTETVTEELYTKPSVNGDNLNTISLDFANGGFTKSNIQNYYQLLEDLEADKDLSELDTWKALYYGKGLRDEKYIKPTQQDAIDTFNSSDKKHYLNLINTTKVAYNAGKYTTNNPDILEGFGFLDHIKGAGSGILRTAASPLTGLWNAGKGVATGDFSRDKYDDGNETVTEKIISAPGKAISNGIGWLGKGIGSLFADGGFTKGKRPRKSYAETHKLSTAATVATGADILRHPLTGKGSRISSAIHAADAVNRAMDGDAVGAATQGTSAILNRVAPGGKYLTAAQDIGVFAGDIAGNVAKQQYGANNKTAVKAVKDATTRAVSLAGKTAVVGSGAAIAGGAAKTIGLAKQGIGAGLQHAATAATSLGKAGGIVDKGATAVFDAGSKLATNGATQAANAAGTAAKFASKAGGLATVAGGVVDIADSFNRFGKGDNSGGTIALVGGAAKVGVGAAMLAGVGSASTLGPIGIILSLAVADALMINDLVKIHVSIWKMFKQQTCMEACSDARFLSDPQISDRLQHIYKTKTDSGDKVSAVANLYDEWQKTAKKLDLATMSHIINLNKVFIKECGPAITSAAQYVTKQGYKGNLAYFKASLTAIMYDAWKLQKISQIGKAEIENIANIALTDKEFLGKRSETIAKIKEVVTDKMSFLIEIYFLYKTYTGEMGSKGAENVSASEKMSEIVLDAAKKANEKASQHNSLLKDVAKDLATGTEAGGKIQIGTGDNGTATQSAREALNDLRKKQGLTYTDKNQIAFTDKRLSKDSIEHGNKLYFESGFSDVKDLKNLPGALEDSSGYISDKVRNIKSTKGDTTRGAGTDARQKALDKVNDRIQKLEERRERFKLTKLQKEGGQLSDDQANRLKELNGKYELSNDENQLLKLLREDKSKSAVKDEIAAILKKTNGERSKLSSDDLTRLNALETRQNLSDKELEKKRSELQEKYDNGHFVALDISNEEKDELKWLKKEKARREEALEKSQLSAFTTKDKSIQASLSGTAKNVIDEKYLGKSDVDFVDLRLKEKEEKRKQGKGLASNRGSVYDEELKTKIVDGKEVKYDADADKKRIDELLNKRFLGVEHRGDQRELAALEAKREAWVQSGNAQKHEDLEKKRAEWFNTDESKRFRELDQKLKAQKVIGQSITGYVQTTGGLTNEEREEYEKLKNDTRRFTETDADEFGKLETSADRVDKSTVDRKKEYLQGKTGLSKEEEEELKHIQARRERFLEIKNERLPGTATTLDPVAAARVAAEKGAFLNDHTNEGFRVDKSAYSKILDANGNQIGQGSEKIYSDGKAQSITQVAKGIGNQDKKYAGYNKNHERLSPERQAIKIKNELIKSTQLGDVQKSSVRQTLADIGAKGSLKSLDTETQLMSKGFSDLRGSMDSAHEFQDRMLELIKKNKGMLPTAVLDDPAMREILEEQEKDKKAAEIADQMLEAGENSNFTWDDEILKERTVEDVSIAGALANMTEEDKAALQKEIEEERKEKGRLYADRQVVEQYGVNSDIAFNAANLKKHELADITEEELNARLKDIEQDKDYLASDARKAGEIARASASRDVSLEEDGPRAKELADKLMKLEEHGKSKREIGERNAKALENKVIISADGKQTDIMTAVSSDYKGSLSDFKGMNQYLKEQKDFTSEQQMYDRMHKQFGFAYDETLKNKLGKNYDLYMSKIGRGGSELAGASDEKILKEVEKVEQDKEFTSSALYQKFKSQHYSENMTQRDKNSVLLAAYEEFQKRKETYIPDLGVSVHPELFKTLKSIEKKQNDQTFVDANGVQVYERIWEDLKNMVRSYGDEALLGQDTAVKIAEGINDAIGNVTGGAKETMASMKEFTAQAEKEQAEGKIALGSVNVAKRAQELMTRKRLNKFDSAIRESEATAAGVEHGLHAAITSVNTLTGVTGTENRSQEIYKAVHESKLRGTDATLMGDKHGQYWDDKLHKAATTRTPAEQARRLQNTTKKSEDTLQDPKTTIMPIIDSKTGTQIGFMAQESSKEALGNKASIKQSAQTLEDEKASNVSNAQKSEVQNVKKLEKANESIIESNQSLSQSTATAINNSSTKISNAVGGQSITNVNVNNDPNVFIDAVVGTSSGNVIR